MVFTIVQSIEFTFRKYENMKMAIWHIKTHAVVKGHKCNDWRNTSDSFEQWIDLGNSL